MNSNPSIVIKTGGSFGPRRNKFDYKNNPPKKFAMLHIRIRNDWECKDARTLFVYYSSKAGRFIDYIAEEDFDKESFFQYEEVWVDEWVRRRNGDLYKLYKIGNIKNETPKRMLTRMKNKIRGYDENDFDLSEEEIYRLDQRNLPLPDKFKIYKHSTNECVSALYDKTDN